MGDGRTTCVLLAVYIDNGFVNGVSFLKKQLESLLNQSSQDFKVLIRDDGSNALVLDVLEGYEAKFPDKFFLVKDKLGNLGYARNFERLAKIACEEHNVDYAFFCDQDDIWHQDKVEVLLKCLQGLEKDYGRGMPLMLNHDATIINPEGETLHRSFNQLRGGRFSKMEYKDITRKSIAYGHSMVFNRSVINMSLPFPEASKKHGHDYHFGFIAKTFGHVRYVDLPLTQYRIHGRNASPPSIRGGRSKFSEVFNILKSPILSLKEAFDDVRVAKRKLTSRMQYVDEFLNYHSANIPCQHLSILQEFQDKTKGLGGHEIVYHMIDEELISQRNPLTKRVAIPLYSVTRSLPYSNLGSVRLRK